MNSTQARHRDQSSKCWNPFYQLSMWILLMWTCVCLACRTWSQSRENMRGFYTFRESSKNCRSLTSGELLSLSSFYSQPLSNWLSCLLILTVNVIINCLTTVFRTLEYLTKHLAHLATLSTKTNMHTRNLALVWAPNLLRWVLFNGHASNTSLTFYNMGFWVFMPLLEMHATKREKDSIFSCLHLLLLRSKNIESSSGNGDMAFQEVRIQQSVVEFILNHTDQIFSSGPAQIKPKEGMTFKKIEKCGDICRIIIIYFFL